jgi:hypothetical protein
MSHNTPQQTSTLENDAFNIRTELMHADPGSLHESELMAQLDQVQNKLSSFEHGLGGDSS